MGGHFRHRSGARRLAVGGALAAGLVGVSTAWACSPQAVNTPVGNTRPVLYGEEVVLEGSGFTHDLIDDKTVPNAAARRAMDDVSQPGYEPVRIVIVELDGLPGDPQVVDRAKREGVAVPVRQAPDYVEKLEILGPSYTVRLRPALGYNHYVAFAMTITGERTRPQTFTYRVVSELPKEYTGEEPLPETTTTLGPLTTPQTTPAGLNRASDPAPAAARQAVARREAAPLNNAPSASAPGGALVAPAPGSATGVADATEVLPPPPLTIGDLWSGLDPATAPSLLDERPAPPRREGLPVGVSALAFGVLMLAGVAGVAGERRLALAKRLRS